jgi:hypothetical protein
MEREELELALTQLINLLNDDTKKESDFQAWFENNPVIFRALGYKYHISHPTLIDDQVHHIPDFMVQRLDDLWEILELKRPDTKVLKDNQKRRAFYSALEEYYSQCREYAEFFREGRNRTQFNQQYDASIQADVPAILVAGRSKDVDVKEIYRILFDRGLKVQYQTYDDMKNRLEFYRAQLFAKYENNSGVSIHLVVALKQRKNEHNHLLDVGLSKDKDRISIFINERDELCFRVINSFGESFLNKVRQGKRGFQYEQLLYLVFELGIGADYSFLSIEINGIHVIDVRIPNLELNISFETQFILGSDVNGKAKTYMRMSEILVYARTLTFEERLRTRNWIFDKYLQYFLLKGLFPEAVLFSGNQFLHAEGHPNFADPIPLSGSPTKPCN